MLFSVRTFTVLLSKSGYLIARLGLFNSPIC